MNFLTRHSALSRILTALLAVCMLSIVLFGATACDTSKNDKPEESTTETETVVSSEEEDKDNDEDRETKPSANKIVAFTIKEMTLYVGESYDLRSVVSGGDAVAADLEYISADPAIATVKGSTLTAVAAGTCTVITRDPENKQSASLSLMVIAGASDESESTDESIPAEGNDYDTQPVTDSMTDPVTDAVTELAPLPEAKPATDLYGQLEKVDFNGKIVTVCNREEIKDDLQVDMLTADLLSDSVFERNKSVSTDYNITFAYVTYSDYNIVNQHMRIQATGNTNDYDLYVGHMYSYIACAQNNYCYNLNKIDSLNLDAEWWDEDCYDGLSFGGKTYLMTGDIFPTAMRLSSCLVFNKTLMTDLEKDVNKLNNLAINGKWTQDQLLTYTAGVSRELNGDDIFDKNDVFGLTAWVHDTPYSLYYGAYEPFLSTEGDEIMLNQDSESMSLVYDKLYKIIVEQKAYFVSDVDLYETTYEVFSDGHALFCDTTLGKVRAFIVNRNMQDEFGILPVPKYDETQTEYRSFVNGAAPFVMICTTERDAEFVGTVLDAMGAYNYDHITPYMYEITTGKTAAEDPVSAYMTELVMRNRVFDMAYYSYWEVSNVVRTGLDTHMTTPFFTSKMDVQLKQMSKRKLPELIKAFARCD